MWTTFNFEKTLGSVLLRRCKWLLSLHDCYANLSPYISHPVYVKRKKKRNEESYFFLSGLVSKLLVIKREMGWNTPSNPIFHVWPSVPISVHNITSIQCVRKYIQWKFWCPKIFDLQKRKLQVQLIKLILHIQQVLMCVTLWLHYKDDIITGDLFGEKFLNDWQVRTLGNSWNIYSNIAFSEF